MCLFYFFQTPNTPNTPSTPKNKLLRAASTPITGPKQQRERLVQNNTPCTPQREKIVQNNTPCTPQREKLLQANTPCTPTERVLRSTVGTPTSPAQALLKRACTPKSDNKAMYRTPMSYKPLLVGNRPVPSPSRQEIWRQELGLTGEWVCYCKTKRQDFHIMQLVFKFAEKIKS